MKQFFSKNGIVLLAAVTIVAVIMCVVSPGSSGTGVPPNGAGSAPRRGGAPAGSARCRGLRCRGSRSR